MTSGGMARKNSDRGDSGNGGEDWGSWFLLAFPGRVSEPFGRALVETGDERDVSARGRGAAALPPLAARGCRGGRISTLPAVSEHRRERRCFAPGYVEFRARNGQNFLI